MAEEIIEFNGAGFIPGVPGEFANCQVVFDSDTKEVLRVEPLGTPPPALEPVESVQQASSAESPTSAQPEKQSAEQENQGG